MWVDIYNRTKNLDSLKHVFESMDDMFTQFDSTFMNRTNPGLSNMLPDGVSSKMVDDDLYYVVNLPGVKKEDVSVKIDLQSRILTITGTYKPIHIKYEKEKMYTYKLSVSHLFEASKPILNKVEDGILYIGFPKKKELDTGINLDIQ